MLGICFNRIHFFMSFFYQIKLLSAPNSTITKICIFSNPNLTKPHLPKLDYLLWPIRITTTQNNGWVRWIRQTSTHQSANNRFHEWLCLSHPPILLTLTSWLKKVGHRCNHHVATFNRQTKSCFLNDKDGGRWQTRYFYLFQKCVVNYPSSQQNSELILIDSDRQIPLR